MVDVAQLVELQVVVLGVAGSSPVVHPIKSKSGRLWGRPLVLGDVVLASREARNVRPLRAMAARVHGVHLHLVFFGASDAAFRCRKHPKPSLLDRLSAISAGALGVGRLIRARLDHATGDYRRLNLGSQVIRSDPFRTGVLLKQTHQ